MLCYSTGSLPELPLEQAAHLLQGGIFRGLEISLNTIQLQQSKSQWITHSERIRELGLNVTNIHLGNPHLLGHEAHVPGLGESNRVERERRMDAVKKAMEIGIWMGASHVTVTSGIRNEGENRKRQEERVFVALQSLLDSAAGEIELGLEQEPEHIIHTTQQLHHLCLGLTEGFGINFDIGHSWVAGEDILYSLKTLLPYIYNLHLEDIQGRTHRHLLFGEGDIPYPSVFELLKELNYKGNMTPDLYPFANNYQKGLRSSEELFKRFRYLFS